MNPGRLPDPTPTVSEAIRVEGVLLEAGYRHGIGMYAARVRWHRAGAWQSVDAYGETLPSALRTLDGLLRAARDRWQPLAETPQ